MAENAEFGRRRRGEQAMAPQACWRLTSSADLRAGRILVTLNDLLLQITWFVLAAILFLSDLFSSLETSDGTFPLMKMVFLLKLQGRAPQNWFDFYFVSGWMDNIDRQRALLAI